MKEALNRKFGGVTPNPTPKVDDVKPQEYNISLSSKPIVPSAQTSNVRKTIY